MNYQNGKIYYLKCKTSNKLYVGSTSQLLQERLNGHVSNYNSWKNGQRRYCSSFDIIKNNNYKIKLIKLYPCNSKQILEIEEGLITKQYKDKYNNDCVNRYIAGRTKQEYREDNEEKIKESNKIYYEKNKDKAIKYYQQNLNKIKKRREIKILCECGSTINKYQLNEHIKTTKHQHFINGVIKIDKMEKIICECGSTIVKRQLKRHERSKKHLKYIDNI